MARALRTELAGGLYHVTSRGDRREAIYRDEQGRENQLALLGQTCERFKAILVELLTGVYTMQEIADHFRVHYSTVSHAVRWLEAERSRKSAPIERTISENT